MVPKKEDNQKFCESVKRIVKALNMHITTDLAKMMGNNSLNQAIVQTFTDVFDYIALFLGNQRGFVFMNQNT